MGPEIFYVGVFFVNAIANMVNGKFTRDQQKNFAVENQKFNEQMESNRQNFQLNLALRNEEYQRAMSENHHRLRLLEQENNFKLMCQSAEWTHFLNKDWPLNNVPSVLRKEQVRQDGEVALRVFFSKSENKFFSTYVYPFVEQGIREFVNCYHNVFESKNIVFYHKAYKEGIYGGAFNMNIKHALGDLPVIIIDTNVLLDEICISATLWGFDNIEGQETTLFKLPFEIKMKDGKIDLDYVKSLSAEILAHLKFVLGYVYDAFNLVMYNRAPLLPAMAKYELNHQEKFPFLQYEEIQKIFKLQYGKMYEAILGQELQGGKPTFAQLPESFKATILHKLRLEYAIATKEMSRPEDFIMYLDESISAWCGLRSKMSAVEFLKDIQGDKEKILKYFSADDVEYFKKLCNAYRESIIETELSECCLSLEKEIDELEEKFFEEVASAEESASGKAKSQPLIEF